MMLLTEINLAFYQIMEDVRRAIAVGLGEFCDAAKTAWRAGETRRQLDA
jgi:hypothetical protein